MASKARPPSKLPFGEHRENTFARAEQSDETVPNRLLQRIADALHVPPSTLYKPPNPVHDPDGKGPPHVVMEDECAVLMHAYTRIRNPVERRRVLDLVQAAAEGP